MEETIAQCITRTVRRYEVRKALRLRNISVDDYEIEEKEKELNISFLDLDYIEIITQEEVWVQKKE
ncbi:hypothetical protein NIES21_14700 [Anabaenopsis circularis NIES-21]|uniref:Uncharacterized protein n=1 Tax=Anabaenopsis circularis NIES-21 TaxID=1085406 RepID=A0A1Z4GDT4_9CYAN|nr:hypothetical protein NIES21_14700 [Anabaenopsis circularis NIES-21]